MTEQIITWWMEVAPGCYVGVAVRQCADGEWRVVVPDAESVDAEL